MTIDPFNLEAIRLPPGMLPEKTVTLPISVRGKNRKQQKLFIMVPLSWHERLLKARHAATLKIALHSLYQHWKSGGKPFALTNNLSGVSRWQKCRALAELEAFGLITVDRRVRKSPLITIIT
jgi:hypothetical protein